jgi:hypothetical protein
VIGTPSRSRALRDLFLRKWAEGGVRLLVNPLADGVTLPARLRTRAPVTLDYDQEPAIPIEDLKADDAGVSATLSFDRSPFSTFVPWTAVLAMAPTGTQIREPAKKPRHLKLVD